MKQHFEFFENLDPELLGERPDADSLVQNVSHDTDVPYLSDHDYKLIALHEFEILCWSRVESGELEASIAEEAIWAFIEYIEHGMETE